jgi:3-hydroxybutyryl-CoA dehydrogenase
MQQIGIIGSGVTGTGIVQRMLQAGFSVVLYDSAEKALSCARNEINTYFARLHSEHALSSEQRELLSSRLSVSASLSSLAGCEYIIEFSPEIDEARRELYRQLNTICSPQCILASTSSTQSITEIAAAVSSPARVVGFHVTAPPMQIQLVEVVKGFHTSDETLQATFALTKRLGLSPVLVKDTPGFIVNRIMHPFFGEALRLLQEGVAGIGDIDRIARMEGGFAEGPFELLDTIGVDVNFAVTRSLYEQTFHEPRYRPNLMQKLMVDAGQLGRTTGRGFYKYKP